MATYNPSTHAWVLGPDEVDFSLSGTANDGILGNSLDNRLTGNDGNNLFDSGGGVDTLIGGMGNDTYGIQDVGCQIVEHENEGIDIVSINSLSPEDEFSIPLRSLSRS